MRKLIAYRCDICNEEWSAVSPHFHERHESSDSHRVNARITALENALAISTTALKNLDTFDGGEISRAALTKLVRSNRALLRK